MEFVGIGLALVICYFIINKLRSFFFKAKDSKLVKDDEHLKSKQTMLEQEISKMKETLNKPTQDLSPDQVEQFWEDNKK